MNDIRAMRAIQAIASMALFGLSVLSAILMFLSIEDFVSRQSSRAVRIMSRQQDDRFLSSECLDALQGQKGNCGVVGDPVHLLGL